MKYVLLLATVLACSSSNPNQLSKKAKDLETLAFHLITMPVIDEYRNL